MLLFKITENLRIFSDVFILDSPVDLKNNTFYDW